MYITRTHALLQQHVEQQKPKIALRTEAVELQRRRIERVQEQSARAERIDHGAAATRERAAAAIRLILWLTSAVVLVLVAGPVVRHAR